LNCQPEKQRKTQLKTDFLSPESDNIHPINKKFI